ncbi:MAG: type I-E CRISPR-associated protein Cse1/CasA [Gammaproteobacteria bacterium]|nr:type I-E CRISPR-associated protein Cse1/CasA [Gammaproteobacteria bacterium]
MSTENRFNLIDEPWIPIVDVGRVSLRQVFSNPEYRALGGNPVQKISLTKLLLAIVQSAGTPEDDEDWAALDSGGLATKCLEYLDQWHDRFYLYGERPFLQIPNLKNDIQNEKEKSPVPIGYSYYPSLPSVTATLLTQSSILREIDLAEQAMFLITQLNMSLRSSAVIKQIAGRSPISCTTSGPGVGNSFGYVHSYLAGRFLQETLWMNVMTRQFIGQTVNWTCGLGSPPWEHDWQSRNSEYTDSLASSYLGCLVGMSRFMLLEDSKIFFSEGLQYPSCKDGWYEPSISIEIAGNGRRPLLLNVNKKPWRELTALLSFLNTAGQDGYNCAQLRVGISRLKSYAHPIGIWSGGLKVTSSMKDQKCRGEDDLIESIVNLPSPAYLTGSGSSWFGSFTREMKHLEENSQKLAAAVYQCNRREIRDSKERDKRADSLKRKAQDLYWQLCERQFQKLVTHSDDAEMVFQLRNSFASFAYKAYDTYCPMDTARQIDAWAKNRPNLSKYLKDAMKDAA